MSAGEYTVTVLSNGCSSTSVAVRVNIILANELPSLNDDLSIYPNPTHEFIYFKLNENLKNPSILLLVNSTGILVKEWTIKNAEIYKLDIEDIPVGTYILYGEINNKKVSFKIIKSQ